MPGQVSRFFQQLPLASPRSTPQDLGCASAGVSSTPSLVARLLLHPPTKVWRSPILQAQTKCALSGVVQQPNFLADSAPYAYNDGTDQATDNGPHMLTGCSYQQIQLQSMCLGGSSPLHDDVGPAICLLAVLVWLCWAAQLMRPSCSAHMHSPDYTHARLLRRLSSCMPAG